MFDITLPTIITSIVLLLVRIILTVTFVAEARFKFKDIRAFAKNDGVPLPVAYVVAIAEGLAAVGMLTGVLAQWAGLGIMLLMIATISLQIFRWHSPYWANKKGWEYDLMVLAFGAIIFAFGPGIFSLSTALIQ